MSHEKARKPKGQSLAFSDAKGRIGLEACIRDNSFRLRGNQRISAEGKLRRHDAEILNKALAHRIQQHVGKFYARDN